MDRGKISKLLLSEKLSVMFEGERGEKYELWMRLSETRFLRKLLVLRRKIIVETGFLAPTRGGRKKLLLRVVRS